MSFILSARKMAVQRCALIISVLFGLTHAAPAYAAAAGEGGFFGGQLGMFAPIILIVIILYFMILRPQRRQIANHQAMVNEVRRGDSVVTAGGIVGKVSRVFDDSGEIEVEIAENVKIRVIRSTLSAVRTKADASSAAKTAGADKKAEDNK